MGINKFSAADPGLSAWLMCVALLMRREVCLRLGFLLAENHSYFVSGEVSKKARKKKKRGEREVWGRVGVGGW